MHAIGAVCEQLWDKRSGGNPVVAFCRLDMRKQNAERFYEFMVLGAVRDEDFVLVVRIEPARAQLVSAFDCQYGSVAQASLAAGPIFLGRQFHALDDLVERCGTQPALGGNDRQAALLGGKGDEFALPTISRCFHGSRSSRLLLAKF